MGEEAISAGGRYLSMRVGPGWGDRTVFRRWWEPGRGVRAEQGEEGICDKVGQ